MPNETPENAIMISKNLVGQLRTAVANGANPMDKLPSDRGLMDLVVQGMIEDLYSGNSTYPIVYDNRPSEERDIEEKYKWFKSDVARSIQANAGVLDKGRFVEAMIWLYMYGEDAEPLLTTGRRIRPRRLTDEEKIRIANFLSGMKAAKDVESAFEPTTLSIT